MISAQDHDKLIDRVANAIWPLDNLSTDESREELRRDVLRGLEASGLLDAVSQLDHLLSAPGGLSPWEMQQEGRRIIATTLIR